MYSCTLKFKAIACGVVYEPKLDQNNSEKYSSIKTYSKAEDQH